ncbi:unnamed protein product [Peronospora belbahrii]|uniref:Uncharacterized protein n=1 Tax=Peronospora belbahrii TaxID=622444 RepID=A0ABN8CQR0_9STRA|nr:unnamed protein product [Peronospora belbahrii]
MGLVTAEKNTIAQVKSMDDKTALSVKTINIEEEADAEEEGEAGAEEEGEAGAEEEGEAGAEEEGEAGAEEEGLLRKNVEERGLFSGVVSKFYNLVHRRRPWHFKSEEDFIGAERAFEKVEKTIGEPGPPAKITARQASDLTTYIESESVDWNRMACIVALLGSFTFVMYIFHGEIYAGWVRLTT